MKQIIPEKSSEKLIKFLNKNSLHKKDFAEMIGVTLSYVYNLIDETVPFSTRGTTIERIATVMGINPEEFNEYYLEQERLEDYWRKERQIQEELRELELEELLSR
jgi:plasmid maintenance system antidote protein VapI